MEIKFINDQITFGQLKFGDLFFYVEAANNTDVYMKIDGAEDNAVNLTKGKTSYLVNTEIVLPLRGKLEVTKI